MKANEVRKMSPEELTAKLGDLKKDLFNLRFQNATKQIDNPLKIVEVRRDIARVQTILREKNGR
ncbi:MAG: 50S ribosomal protein L29 [Clostridiaceae bacterium]|nr:50S ribosomal protein L29 [Clostridiales bacterium]MDD6876526.1 50S ribosomal protein L29 [Clostridiaceae bacterium]MDY3072204.1 50S ribosomal protein L29 [Eubacteriales bacterium]MDY3286131.1 50S ribosomal protein L29 [Eubacteriales bacterium]MDY5016515.1 50S ribosomal protein L29 [Eubacteriales bacterium]